MQKSVQQPILPVRILAWLAFPFGLGCLLSVTLLPVLWAFVLAGVAGIAALVFSRLVAPWRIRAILALAGLSLGLAWCAGYALLLQNTVLSVADSSGEFSGVVLSVPVSQDSSQTYVQAKLQGYGTARLYIYDDIDLKVGDTVVVTGKAYASSSNNQALGVYLNISVSAVTVTGFSDSPLYWPARLSAAIRQTILQLYTGDVAALFVALLTGDRALLSTSLSTALSRCGLSHMVAVSGMHLSCLSGLLFVLLRRRRSRLLAIPFLVFFAVMVGSVSAYRALLMAIVLLLAPVFRRESDPITSLGFALLLILLQNPLCVQTVSFQLSFSAMLGLTVFAPALYGFFAGKVTRDTIPNQLLRHLLRILLQIIVICLSACLFTTPLVAWYFGQISLVSLPANLLVSWMLSFLLILGLLSVVAAMVYLPLGTLLAIPAAALATVLLTLVRYLAGFSFAAILLNSPYLVVWGSFSALMVVFALLMLRNHRRPTVPLCAIAVVLCLCLLLNRWGTDRYAMTVKVLDVGQGQSILLLSQGLAAAVDCGGSGYDSAGDILADQLQSLGLSRLELMIFTHLDSDHINGIQELFDRIQIGNVIIPDCTQTADSQWLPILQELCDGQGTTLVYLSQELDLTLGQVSVSIYPPMDTSADNNSSLASLWQTDSFSMLITGDMDSQGEWMLIAHESLPDIDLLIVGHHGSSSSTSQRLLDAVTPELAIISVGADNTYGHPTDAVLTRLQACGIAIYRTDLSGTITVTVPD